MQYELSRTGESEGLKSLLAVIGDLPPHERDACLALLEIAKSRFSGRGLLGNRVSGQAEEELAAQFHDLGISTQPEPTEHPGISVNRVVPMETGGGHSPPPSPAPSPRPPQGTSTSPALTPRASLQSQVDDMQSQLGQITTSLKGLTEAEQSKATTLASQ